MNSLTIPIPDWGFIEALIVFVIGGWTAFQQHMHRKHESKLASHDSAINYLLKETEPREKKIMQESVNNVQMGISK